MYSLRRIHSSYHLAKHEVIKALVAGNTRTCPLLSEIDLVVHREL